MDCQKFYDVIVIGSGIGGLTCGAYLASFGHRVLILEQNKRVGGYLSTLLFYGNEIDIRMPSMTSAGIVFPVLNELGILNIIPFRRATWAIKTPLGHFPVTSIPQVTDALKQMFPTQHSGIDAYFREIGTMFPPIENFMKNNPLLGISSIWKSVYAIACHPFSFTKLVKFLFEPSARRINQFIDDPGLQYLLEMPGYPGMAHTLQAAVWYSFIHDYWYPAHGFSSLTTPLIDIIKSHGGQILCGTKAQQIIIDGKKAKGVRIEDGFCINSCYVVSNADITATFTQLVGVENLPSALVNRVKTAKVSPGYLELLIETSCIPQKFKKMGVHTLYFPSLQERDKYRPYFIISFPEWAGSREKIVGSIGYISTFWPFSSQEPYVKPILDLLYSEGINVNRYKVITPKDFSSIFSVREGASAGWSWDCRYLFQPPYGIRLPIKNLYTVGQWSFPFGGIPGAMLAARMAAFDIQKNIIDLKSKHIN